MTLSAPLRIACMALALAVAAPSPAAAADVADLRRVSATLEARNYNTVHFDFDKDLLDRRARGKLQRQADFILRRPDVRFAVTGHTDKVGNTAYNRALGLRRAKRVVAHLVALGVDPGQLQAMVSQGEERPVVRTEDRERLNRRVVTTVILPRRAGDGVTVAGGSPSRSPSPTPVPVAVSSSGPAPTSGATTSSTPVATAPAPTSPTGTDTTTSKPRPGNSSFGTGKPDAGSGNGDEPSGDPAGSVGRNRGGDEHP